MKETSRNTVLVVDDDFAVLSVAKYMLTHYNFVPLLVQSGKEAIQLYQQNTPVDLVLLDIKMPSLSGIDTLKSLKYKRPTVPIIMITGYGTDREINDAYTFGAADIVYKPFDKEELLQKVRYFI